MQELSLSPLELGALTLLLEVLEVAALDLAWVSLYAVIALLDIM